LFLHADHLENYLKSACGGCAARPHGVSGSIPLISTNLKTAWLLDFQALCRFSFTLCFPMCQQKVSTFSHKKLRA
jgi:hypothetical protein